MATQTITIPCAQFAMVDGDQPNANYHGAEKYRIYAADSAEKRYPLISFGPVPSGISRRRLESAELRLTFDLGTYSGYVNINVRALAAGFDEDTVTRNTMPERLSYGYWLYYQLAQAGQQTITMQMVGTGQDQRQKNAAAALSLPGITLFAAWPDSWLDLYAKAAAAGLQPALIVTYDDSLAIIPSQIAVANAPTSGYLNPRNATTFAWGYSITEPDYCVADTVTQASATFYWREGSSGDFTAVQISGETMSVTIPANTFPINSSIDWYVEGTDTVGSTSQTAVYTLNTAAALVYSTPVEPVSTVEDGSGAITFRWSTQSADGYPATGYDLLYKKPSDSSWTRLARSETEAGGSYTAPADTFLAGEYVWGVNVQNIDGVWSSGNPSARFVVVAAPPAPSVTVTPVPFATVNWQVEGQQAYRITVDGTVYGPYFGASKSWTVPDYLRDGEHTITVEVQGVYGLWSQPGSATFTVRNQAGTPITLEGEFDRDAALSWTAGDAAANYYIYRDDVQIGHTSGLSFNDRLALGPHTYRAINRLPDGNYSISNTVEGTMLSCTPAIAPLRGGAWIELRLSENSDREESFTWSQGVSLRHFAGATYPVAELSPYADESGAYDAAFTDLPSARAFESLRGQPVILKSRGGNVMIGILATLSKRMLEFYIAYVFTLQRMHWRDWIDADD